MTWSKFMALFLIFLNLYIYAEPQKRALLILSYHPEFSTSYDVVNGVKEIFAPEKILLDVEFMDSKRFFDQKNLQIFKQSLSYKLSRLKPYDIILSSDDNALQFIVDNYDELFANKPVVFSGVNNRDFALSMNKVPLITGVIEAISVRETIDLARQLQPATKRIITLAENSKSGEANLKSYRKAIENYEGIELVDYSLKNYTFAEFQPILNSLKYPNDTILLLSAYKDKNGSFKTMEEVISWLNSNAEIPIYHLWKHGPGNGALGGKVVHHSDQGKAAAKMALRILKGESPKNIPVLSESPNRLVVDWNYITKFNIPTYRIPSQTSILNFPTSIYQQHKDKIIPVFILIFFLSILNVFLLRNIQKRKQAEERLRENEENLSITLNSIGDAVIATDAEGKITKMNPVAENLTGWSAVEAQGQDLETVFEIIDTHSRNKADNPFSKVMTNGLIVGLANHTVLISKDRSERQIADSGAPIKNKNGEIIGIVLVFRDVTDEYELQEQLIQSQKIEAIGQLAGGVAHDFNNMLVGILASAEMLALELAEDSDKFELCNIIINTSLRAADLTSQLLTFSRKGTLHLSVVDFHEVVEQSVAMLSRSIDKQIKIHMELRATQTMVYADMGQLKSVLLNLGINARDAIDGKGDIFIGTSNTVLSESDSRESLFDIAPGEFIKLIFKDTGTGMSEKVLSRIFEPFYTTKEPGKGTGLGLSAVFGSINRHRGTIHVRSEVNKGTEFEILLPITFDKKIEKNEEQYSPSGSGKILVIDDEKVVRVSLEKLIGELGYEVIAVEDGVMALGVYQENYSEIDLVLLDLIMPNMNGKECFQKLKKINPDVKVIILSGYPKDIAIKDLKDKGVVNFIQKPFRRDEIAKIISSALCRP